MEITNWGARLPQNRFGWRWLLFEKLWTPSLLGAHLKFCSWDLLFLRTQSVRHNTLQRAGPQLILYRLILGQILSLGWVFLRHWPGNFLLCVEETLEFYTILNVSPPRHSCVQFGFKTIMSRARDQGLFTNRQFGFISFSTGHGNQPISHQCYWVHAGCNGIRVSICKTFAERNAKFFFLWTSVLREKNNNLRNHSQKSFRKKLPYSAFAKLKFRTIPQLEFSANYAKKNAHN